MRTGIILADEQIPYHIPQLFDEDTAKKNPKHKFPIEQFMEDLNPDIIIRVGDMLDMEALQGWNHRRPADVNWEEIREEIRVAKLMMDRQDALLKRSVEKHFIFGNHEERLKHFRAQHDEYWRKNRSTMPYLMRDLELKERGYLTHGQNDLFQIGKLHFFHGNDYSTHHTQKNLAALEANVCYGHVHSPQRFTKVARVNNSPKSAWSLGCLCSRNPVWKNGAPNAWVNGFGVCFWRDDGSFNLYQVDITCGQFIGPNGKLYK